MVRQNQNIHNMLHGCGNSFLIVDEFEKEIVVDKKRYVIENADGEGVDGILFLAKPKDPESTADLEMRIFDRDGTEETMCGNGLRCFARYAHDNNYIQKLATILTGDGPKQVEIDDDNVSVVMGSPNEFMDVNSLKMLKYPGYFAHVGVPHLIQFNGHLTVEEARKLGQEQRYNQELLKRLEHEEGININFVKIVDQHNINLLTYEVGVENVTKACGTGSTAAAYAAHLFAQLKFPITVHNRGGDIIIDYKENKLIMTGKAEYMAKN
jgi:diaminopimelate epimerase